MPHKVNEPKSERWWDSDKSFSEWFDEEYGTTDIRAIAIGIVSSSQMHEKFMPSGFDGSYVTEKLVQIIDREKSRSRTDALKEAVNIMKAKKRDTICESGECKIPSYPICRHAMGWNDAIDEGEAAILSLIKEDALGNIEK